METNQPPGKIVRVLPKIEDLVKADRFEENAFMVLMNQEPPKQWLKAHPTIKKKDENNNSVPYVYMPRERLEYLLSAIFTEWNLEIRDSKIMANSVVVTVRLHFTNPVTGKEAYHDGIGAAPLQTNQGAGAVDFNALKSAAVQMAAPAAETYAFKDACEKIGKLFGKDLNVRDIDYDVLYKDKISLDDLKELYELKKESLTETEQVNAERIINNQEERSYRKLHRNLSKL